MAGRFAIGGAFTLRTGRFRAGLTSMNGMMRRSMRQWRGGLREVGHLARRFRGGLMAAGAAVAGVTASVVGLVAALRDVANVGMDFDRTMAAAGARMNGGIGRGDEAFEQMEQSVRSFAASTEFGATEGAQALLAMGQAGFDAAQAASSLPGIGNLAAAAQVDLAEATSIAADALGQWGLMAEDAEERAANLARLNDVLAITANSANLGVQDVSQTFRDAGPAARRLGVGLEQASAMIDVLAQAGIRGANAGTGFRNVLGRLTPTSRAATRAFQRLGVATSIDGEIRPAIDVLGDLQTALGELGGARRETMLRTIFGEEASGVASILMADVDGIRKLEGAIRSSGDTAANMAGLMRNTAAGDVASFDSTIESLKLEVWDLVRGPFREIVQATTEWIRANRGWISSGLRDGISWLSDNMPAIVTWTTRIAIGMGVLIGAIALVGASILAAAAVLPSAIVGAIALLIGAYVWLRDTGIQVAAAVSEVFTGVAATLQEAATAVVEFVVGALTLMARQAAPVVRPVFAAIVQAASWVQERWAPVGAFFGRVWASVATAAGEGMSMLREAATGAYDHLVSVWEPIAAFFAGLWDAIASSFTSTVGGVLDGVSEFVHNVRVTGREVLDGDDDSPPPPPQIVSPQEIGAQRTAELVSQTTTNSSEVSINVSDNRRIEATQRRARGGSTLRFSRTGGL